MRSRLAAVAALVLSWTACFLFTVDGRPCTEQGECLPGFTCVEGLCKEAGRLKIGEACLGTGECVDGTVCAEATCDDADEKACEQPADCGADDALWLCFNKTCLCKRECRPGCSFPDFAACQSGQLCYLDVDQDLGFCQEGNCGEREDGTSVGTCAATEVCLEFNGRGSGLCTAMCTILEQNLACLQSPAPSDVLCCAENQNCEHIAELWGAPQNPQGQFGICFDSGVVAEGDPCSNSPADNRFCQRGLVCDGGSCRKYCNQSGTNPTCGAGYNCIPFAGAGAIPYGRCQPAI